MKIPNLGPNYYFSHMNPGDVFAHDGEMYMRIDRVSTCEAVNLKNGSIQVFEGTDEVRMHREAYLMTNYIEMNYDNWSEAVNYLANKSKGQAA
jgi:hypothetical protein